MGLFDRDNPLFADFLHGLSNQTADLRVPVRTDDADLGGSASVVIFLERRCSSTMTAATALSTPRRTSIGASPAATARPPSRTIDRVSTIAVVVPSPAVSLVLVAT